MSADETLAWLTFISGSLGTVFMGISAIKAIAMRAGAVGLTEYVVCPNCGQPFDASKVQGFSPGKYLRTTTYGRRRVTCPRCRHTFEA